MNPFQICVKKLGLVAQGIIDSMKLPHEVLVAMAFKIKNARVACNLSQEDVSMSLGMTRISVVNMESGSQSPTIDNLLKFSKLFKCHPSDLLPSNKEYDPVLHEIIPTAVKAKKRRIEKLKKEIERLERS